MEFIARTCAVPAKIKLGENFIRVARFLTADPDIFEILKLALISGDWRTLADNPNSVVINQEMADKFFENESPLGKVLEVDCYGELYEMQVAGVMKNVPRNSTFQANFIAPLYMSEKYWNKRRSSWAKMSVAEDWRFNMFITYFLLSDKSPVSQLESKLPAFTQKYQKKEIYQFGLQPMADFYFHSSDFINYRFVKGNLANIYIYSAVAFLILLIASINFIILSTARSLTRSKEVGIRKAVGACRTDLIKQMMGESIILPFIALPVALLLVEFFLPSFSVLLGKRLESVYYQNWEFILGFMGVTLMVGLLSGSYISFYLSAYNPLDVLKGKLTSGVAKSSFRKVLISLQMIIFVGLIITSVIIYQQMRFFHNKNFGFNKENIMTIGIYKTLGNNYEAFKNELKKIPGVVNVSAAQMLPPTDSKGVWQVPSRENPEKLILVEGLAVDFDFIETFEFEVIQGRSFSSEFPSDNSGGYVVNETLLKELGIDNPIGESLDKKNKIIGVVKDFNLHSLREKIAPLAISITDKYLHEMVLRLHHGNILSTIESIKQKWSEFCPEKPMEFSFFDERIDALYQNELKFAETIRYFTFLAILVACMGLFGLTLFISEQRTKEIGIRKVLGASIPTIVSTLLKEFIVLILTANIIAWPVAYMLINVWLQNFAYRVSPGFGTFIIAGLISLSITFMTISGLSARAARANPVKALRCE